MRYMYINLSRRYNLVMNPRNKLAVYGGNPVITSPMKNYSSIDDSDLDAVTRVIKSRNLSQFIGDAGEYFLGGTEVRDFEEKFSKKFLVKHSISTNSWTSGLWASIGALELEPGSEVITSSWTMAATATTILHWNLVPVFADICERTFNLDAISVERQITSRTRAIVSPDIFGQSADIESLLELCKKYNLYLVSDSAQAPLAKRHSYYAGTASHIGGYSFNYHKHIHTGEGGMLVTNDDHLADRLQLLRNHGEVALSRRPTPEWQYGILGMNIRLGELEAAIGKNQLDKLNSAVASRSAGAKLLTEGIKGLKGLSTPFIDEGNDHVFYLYGLRINFSQIGIERDSLILALKAEGVPALMSGYQNLHNLPLFRHQLTYKKNSLPYSLISKKRARELRKQYLPISEELHNRNFVGINWCSKEFAKQDVLLIIEAFRKVWNNLDSLRNKETL